MKKMRIIELRGKTGDSKIMLGESIEHLSSYCNADNSVIVTDSNVRKACGAKFPKEIEVMEIGVGEESKTLETVAGLYEKLLECGLDRSSSVIGIGGGIVCDIAGFVATTYMRGMKCGFVPTTLLSQVDASIGGKNGVNLKGYKNMIGTFRQPEFVLCDFELLKTLPERELRCGFAEIVKHGAIGDAALFDYLEENHKSALSLKKTAIEKVVHDSLAVKSRIVERDETEHGERMKLNFGHTIGHGIEKAAAFERLEPQFKQIEKVAGLPHGEAVSIGMVAEARLSVAKGMLSEKDATRLAALLENIGLPIKPNARCDRATIIDAIRKDKKKRNDRLNVVLLDGIGKAKVAEISEADLEVVLNDLC